MKNTLKNVPEYKEQVEVVSDICECGPEEYPIATLLTAEARLATAVPFAGVVVVRVSTIYIVCKGVQPKENMAPKIKTKTMVLFAAWRFPSIAALDDTVPILEYAVSRRATACHGRNRPKRHQMYYINCSSQGPAAFISIFLDPFYGSRFVLASPTAALRTSYRSEDRATTSKSKCSGCVLKPLE